MESINNYNVILITIDCLRADHIGCLGYKRNITPCIDSLAYRSYSSLFTQAYSNAPYTNASVASFLTGTYPLYRGNVFIRDRPTVAEILKKKGYSTAAFHSNPQLSRLSEYKRGFDVFDDVSMSSNSNDKIKIDKHGFLQKLNMEFWNKVKKSSVLKNIFYHINYHIGYYINTKRHQTFPYSSAMEINKKAIQWLDNSSSPFFLWLHYMDTHYPYNPPRVFFEDISDEQYNINKGMLLFRKAIGNYYQLSIKEKKYLINLYDASIKHVDCAIGDLMSKLGENGMIENTYVILTADHGEEFWDHGHFGHEGHPEKIRSMKLYDEMLHVPLIIFCPGIKGDIVDQPLSLIDIVPTIFDFLNIRYSQSRILNGKSATYFLKNPKGDDDHFPIIAEATEPGDPFGYLKNPMSLELFSYKVGKWKYIYYSSRKRADELYDLKRDPKETINLISDYPDVAKELRSKILDHINSKTKNFRSEKQIVKSKIRELKSFGKI